MVHGLHLSTVQFMVGNLFLNGVLFMTPNDALKAARIKHNLSQGDLAEEIGTTTTNVSRWERGITSPTPYYRRRLCEYFRMPPEKLFSHLTKWVEIDLPNPAPYQDIPSKDEETKAIDNHVEDDVFFYNTTTLPDPEEFFGRRREKRQIPKQVKKGPVSIVGSRRVGKTWLLQYLKAVAHREIGEQVIIGYLDAAWPSCETLPQLLSTVVEQLGIPQPLSEDERNYLQALEVAVKRLVQNNRIPVLCIDRFERLCKLPDLRLDTLEKLRAIAQIGLRLVTASQKPLGKIIQDAFGEADTSPFANVFMQFKLNPFTREEAKEFLQRKGEQAGFSVEEHDRLLQLTRQKDAEFWSPSKLQLAGTLLHNDKILAWEGYSYIYRPNDPVYWQEFEQRMNEEAQE